MTDAEGPRTQTERARQLPDLDPEQFVGDAPAGDSRAGEFVSDDQSGGGPTDDQSGGGPTDDQSGGGPTDDRREDDQ